MKAPLLLLVGNGLRLSSALRGTLSRRLPRGVAVGRRFSEEAGAGPGRSAAVDEALSSADDAPVPMKKMATRRSNDKKKREDREPRAPKAVDLSQGGLPLIARCHASEYIGLLGAKVAKLRSLVSEVCTDAPEDIDVFESPRANFRIQSEQGCCFNVSEEGESRPIIDRVRLDTRDASRRARWAIISTLLISGMRASFKLWREGARVHYVMFNLGDSKTMHDITEYPMGSHRLNEMMTGFLEALNGVDDVLRRNVNDVRFLTTLKGESLICVTYNRPLKDDEDWKFAAETVRQKLGLDGLIGRSRKVKIVLGEEHIREELVLADEATVNYLQTEGAFTQPNAKVCQSMLSWARDVTQGAEGDLCEMYCGNGCFTVALAPNFRRVVATEISRTSVDLANRNLALNKVTNVQVAAVSAESFSQAYFGNHTLNRLRDVDFTGLSTLLVDPPRAGLDDVCLKLAANFQKVLYISCNPETLARDLAQLGKTHEIKKLAAFDQFPYTEHLEAGVYLERREQAPPFRQQKRRTPPTLPRDSSSTTTTATTVEVPAEVAALKAVEVASHKEDEQKSLKASVATLYEPSMRDTLLPAVPRGKSVTPGEQRATAAAAALAATTPTAPEEEEEAAAPDEPEAAVAVAPTASSTRGALGGFMEEQRRRPGLKKKKLLRILGVGAVASMVINLIITNPARLFV